MKFMTSDGITNQDWKQVMRFACMIANASARNRCKSTAMATGGLLSLLDRLEIKYGPRPSLLATKADYVEECSERVVLLLQAYRLAKIRHDSLNMELICSSLARLYLFDVSCLRKGNRWLSRYESALAENGGHGETRTLVELRARAQQLAYDSAGTLPALQPPTTTSPTPTSCKPPPAGATPRSP